MLIYDGVVDFSFDEPQHKYLVKKLVGKDWTIPTPVVGTTTVCGIIAKEALIGWSAKTAAYHIRDNLKDLKDLAGLAEEAKREYLNLSKAGRATGSVGHALVEALLMGEKYTMPTAKEPLDAATSVKKAFEAWREDFVPEVVKVEEPFYSLLHNFAGKCDLVATIGGKLTLIDFKTTKTSTYNPDGIYADNFCQLGGYLQGIEEMTGLEIEEAIIVNLPKDGGEYKVRSLSDLGLTKTDAKLWFLNALGTYNLNGLFSSRVKGG